VRELHVIAIILKRKRANMKQEKFIATFSLAVGDN